MTKSNEQDIKPEVKDENKSTTEKVQEEKKSTTEQTEKSTSKEQENERLKGQISALQKKLEIQSSEFEKIRNAFSKDEEGEKTLQLEDVLSEVKNLKDEIGKKNLEIEKNNYIDSLEVSEARKKTLKQLADSESYEKDVERINNSFDEVIASESRKPTDTRPRGEGVSNQSEFSVKDILENEDKYKRAKGII